MIRRGLAKAGRNLGQFRAVLAQIAALVGGFFVLLFFWFPCKVLLVLANLLIFGFALVVITLLLGGKNFQITIRLFSTRNSHHIVARCRSSD
jgi:uncharacterized RDD family membrane protein YckC